ncbi:MAG: secretin N-terminal domain-containing protein [Planctomycetota bacterium]
MLARLGLALVGLAALTPFLPARSLQDIAISAEGTTIGALLDRVAAREGISFRLSPPSIADQPLGLQGRARVPRARLLAWSRAVLAGSGYAMTPLDAEAGVYLVERREGSGFEAASARTLDPGELDACRGEESGRVVVTFPLRGITPADALRLLARFAIARPGAIVEGPDGRSVVVADAPAVAWRMGQVLRIADSGARGAPRRFGTLRLLHHDAGELGEALARLVAPVEGAAAATGPTVSFDRRSNAVLVAGTEDEVLGLVEIAALLDLEARRPEALFRTYRLRHVDAEELAASLRGAFGLDPERPDPEDGRDARDEPGSGGEEGAASPGRASGARPEPGRGRVDEADRRTARATPRRTGAGESPGGEDPPRIASLAEQNAIIVYGTRTQLEWIDAAVVDLDRPLVPLRVEVAILDLSDTDAETFGVEVADVGGGALGHLVSTAFGLSSYQGAGGDLRREPRLDLPGLVTGVLGGSVGLPLLLHAVKQTESSRLVTSLVTTVDELGHARIAAGRQIPTVERIGRSSRRDPAPGAPLGFDDLRTTERFNEYFGADMALDVSPLRYADDAVRLALRVDLEEFTADQTDPLAPPPRGARRLATEVTVPAGATVMIGRLQTSNRGRTRRSVPVLDGLPLIGDLLGSTTTSEERRLLVAFLTVSPLE